MRNWFCAMAIAIVTLTTAGCTGNKVYDKYQHTFITGWEKNDTLNFSVPRMAASGNYAAGLMLRINGSYPFMSLTMIVEQKVMPAMTVRTDTLKCDLMDAKGNTKGHGTFYYQYSFPIATMPLAKGDSLQVTIRHDMKREILPGVSDVGYSLSLH